MSIEIIDYNGIEIERVDFNAGIWTGSIKPDYISVKISLNGFTKFVNIKDDEFDQVLGFIKKIILIELSK